MRKLFAMIICAAMLLSLPGVSVSAKTTATKDADMKTIYVIVKVIGNQYWSVVQAGAEQAGKDFGCEVVIVGTAAESDIEGQVRYLQDAVSAKADGIVIAPLDRVALAEPIKEQYQSDTPIVLIDSSVEGEDFDACLSTDNIEAGRMSAEELLRRMKESGLSEKETASVAIQAGSTGSMAINDRLKGFYEFWDENAPKAWKVLKDDVKINDGDIAKAVAFCQDFLTTYPDLKAVFGPNNGSTVGFVTGLTEAKRTDIIMVGFDFSSEIETMIRSNEYSVSSVLQRQYFMGYDGVKLALDLADGKEVEEKVIDTGVMLVTPENVDSEEVQNVINPGVGAAAASGTLNKKNADDFDNKELNIAVFEGGYGRAYWDDIVVKFEEAYPGVKVNMNIDPEIGQILAPQIAVGDWPDFISLSDTERSGVVASMIKNKELLDLTDVYDGESIDRPGVSIRDIIVPGMLESTKFAPYDDGNIYLAPFNVGPMGMVYNKTLFEEKGWELPSTWEEFFALGEELKKPENYVEIDGKKVQRSLFTYQGIYAGYLESVFWPAIAGAGGMDAIEAICAYEEGSFLTPQVTELVSTFAEIGTGDYLMEGTVALNHTQSQTDMMLGKALFIPNGTWMEGEMADAPREEGFEFAIIPAPTMSSDDDHYVLSSYEQFEIPKQAKNPELAKEFLRFLYTEESILSFAKNANGTLAVTDAKDIAADELSSGVYGMFSAYETGKFMLMNFESLPADCKVNVGAVVFDDNMGPLMTGKLSPEDYCAMVEEAFEEIRADMEKQ